MLNFLDLCSLDIHYDLESNAILYGEHIKYTQFQKVGLKNLAPVLLNKSLTYPVEVYEEYIGVFHESDQAEAQVGLSYDLINLPAGLLGIEFIKTHVYYAPEKTDSDNISSIVEVLHGSLTILVQRNMCKDQYDCYSRVNDGYLVKLNKGEKFVIPDGYYYTFINTSEDPVVFSRAYRKNCVADYNQLKKERGLAYYCIRKNGREEIVMNPLYRGTPQIKVVNCEHCLIDHSLDTKRSLYDQIRNQIQILVKEINA